MALSKQSAPLRNLVILKAYAKRLGVRVTESFPEDAPNPGVHNPNSWHYDSGTHRGTTHSLAADFNYGVAGASQTERDMLAHLVTVAQSLGLAVIYALYGTTGSAGAHRTHLHADVGSVTNLGKGPRKPTPGDAVVWDTQPVIHAAQDNLAGNETKRRLAALREASNYGGRDFPFGVEFTQDVVGTKEDGAWGPKSRAAHDTTMEKLQDAWKQVDLYAGEVDGIWGPKMEAGYRKFLDRYGR